MEADKEKKHMEDKNPKRKMKTPSQLEILEKVYAEDKYPSEVVRAELSVQLNLTDRQLQMWFCHRRLKDRKVDENPSAAKKQKKEKTPAKKEAAVADSSKATGAAAAVAENVGEFGEAEAKPVPVTAKREGGDGGSKKRNQHVAAAAEQQRIQSAELAAIRLVEEQLGEPLREDGPILGCEFDPLPPGAFDTPIAESAGQRMFSLDSLPVTRAEAKPSPSDFAPLLGGKRMPVPSPQTASRVPREHQFIPEHPTGGQFYERNSVSKAERESSKAKSQLAGSSGLATGLESRVPNLSLNFFPPSEGSTDNEAKDKSLGGSDKSTALTEQERPRVDKKRKACGQSDDAKLAKELEAQEKRLKKEAEKQEAVRRKKEEQERKELEKINREKQKELEKIMREKAREEERQLREQKKEHERLERLAQKEQQRVEKLRLKEEMRREKEAAKLKAAYERATAKKLAKLSTGLMDDEQLELMQMGAFVQGLVSGDMEGGAGFDPSKVVLKRFPPTSVRMKKVLGVSPWDSEPNVANLLMVWRFLTTFSDAIGLWPFTVDEFVQGLHDFDSRLLNEVYIALLKTLIKDVEDAAQAAASGTAGSQHAIAVAAGGHPQIVEAAYTWGFDIQEWGQHMNPLTWPEILRQFALAAGYGPKWKKRFASADSKGDYLEVNDGQNAHAIATLRSGAAAVNAVALMRGKNASRIKLRKSQHPRLTPGTVKYAAFHVLSIEGNKGLTILELTDRIQKSGLRDLSSSKTPEASISAALSRDTYLFERVAPSTYCVRSPFRRDVDEAEEVLQAALERTYLFQTRQLDPDKDEDDAEEADEESEGEEQEMEEQEPENYQASGGSGKVILRLKQQGKVIQVAGNQDRETAHAEPSSWVAETSVSETSKLHEPKLETEDDLKQNRHGMLDLERKPDDDEMEIDESQVGEPWVQGLMEGEFADLSIEERLNSLVALVDVLNEGNTIRAVLEERYESASALKRQLWEEVQVDKRRLKEELLKSGAKADAQDDEKPNLDPFDNVASTSTTHSDKSRAQMKAEIRLRAEKLYVIRSLPLGEDRRHNRYWQFAASTGGEDPGRARLYFECNEDGHWEVIDTEEALDALVASLDTRGVREASLYNVLTHLGGPLRKAMKGLAQSRAVDSSKSEGSPSSGVFGPSSDSSDVSSAVSVELGRSKVEVQHAMDRYRDLDRWVWSQCFRKGEKSLKAFSLGKKRDVESLISCEVCYGLYWPKEKHCLCCHLVIDCKNDAKYTQHVRECEAKFRSDSKQGVFSQVLPSRIQLLKHLLLAVEVAIPADAFKGFWTTPYRTAWCNTLKLASSSGELLQAFTELESAVEEEWISSSYETTEKALSTTHGVCGQAKNLPWVPQTTAAVAARLMAFDAAIAYNTEQRQLMEDQSEDEDRHNIRDVTGPDVHDESPEGTSSQDDDKDSDSPPDLQNGHVGSMHGRRRAQGSSGRGGHTGNFGSHLESRRPAEREEHYHQSHEQQQQPGRGGWGFRGRGGGRLSFRIEGRRSSQESNKSSEDLQFQHQQQNHAAGAADDDSSQDEAGGWEGQESDDTDHSYDERQQQQQHQQQQQRERGNNNIGGTAGDESDEEEQQGNEEEYEVEYEEQGMEYNAGGGASDEEVEVEEVEEVDEEDEVLSDDSG